MRPDTADYRRLFLGAVPLLDTRAPREFTQGAIPGAVNLPLMNDEERAAVGRCYQSRGQAAAVELGHRLVSGERREGRLSAWREFTRAHPNGYLYCFRGGMRSQLAQHWLAEVGVDYPCVIGGYKAMRRFLLDSLEQQSQQARFLLIAGATGSGKTRAVLRLSRAIDLEALAGHRGSAFGHLLQPQPAQIDFENAISVELLQRAEQPGPVLLEDEGRLIGRLALPESLRQRMAGAPLLVIEEPLASRVQVLLEDYIVDLGERYRVAHGADGQQMHRERLLGDLSRIRKRLGGERQQRAAGLMEGAFEQQARGGGIDAHRAWIEFLLVEYYDPMYAHQMNQRQGERLFVGSRESLVAYVRDRFDDAVA